MRAEFRHGRRAVGAAPPDPGALSAGRVASLGAVGGVLAQRNARIFYSGSVVCWTGSWIQRIAADWMAWELTHSTLWVGIIEIGRAHV